MTIRTINPRKRKPSDRVSLRRASSDVLNQLPPGAADLGGHPPTASEVFLSPSYIVLKASEDCADPRWGVMERLTILARDGSDMRRAPLGDIDDLLIQFATGPALIRLDTRRDERAGGFRGLTVWTFHPNMILPFGEPVIGKPGEAAEASALAKKTNNA